MTIPTQPIQRHAVAHKQVRLAPSFQPPAPISPGALRRTLFTARRPLTLTSGRPLGPVTVTYETYGALNASRSNAVYVCHALTGDSHVARAHESDWPGWWDTVVGPGCPIDTDRYFVVCANVLGGCAGTTGPWSCSSDGLPFELRFPAVSVADIVHVHRALIAELAIDRLAAVIGGSLGAMQALQWFLESPQEAAAFLVIAGSSRLSAENLAWNAISRAAIRHDLTGAPRADGGSSGGLGLARMVAHITYLSEKRLEAKFGHDRQKTEEGEATHPAMVGGFSIERYLEHQADSLESRFDVFSYLYLTLAMDEFQPFREDDRRDFSKSRSQVALYSFASDRLFGVHHSEVIDAELRRRGAAVSHCIDESDTIGHDAFLVDSPYFLGQIRSHFEGVRL